MHSAAVVRQQTASAIRAPALKNLDLIELVHFFLDTVV